MVNTGHLSRSLDNILHGTALDLKYIVCPPSVLVLYSMAVLFSDWYWDCSWILDCKDCTLSVFFWLLTIATECYQMMPIGQVLRGWRVMVVIGMVAWNRGCRSCSGSLFYGSSVLALHRDCEGIWDCNGIARILRCVLEPLLIGLMPDVVQELCGDLKLVIMLVTVWIVAIVVGMLMDV